MRITCFVLLLLVAAALSAAPTATSIHPNTGVIYTFTPVTITGSGFDSTAEVFVGETRLSVVNNTGTQIFTLIPPRPHGDVADVRVRVNGEEAVLARGFRWDEAATLSDPVNFERYLVPVTGRNLPGANGSLWTTELTLHNGYTTAIAPIWNCCSPGGLPVPSPVIQADQTIQAAINPRGDGTDGAFIHLPKGPVRAFGMSLRVRDLSENAGNFGTEIPLVTESDYHAEHGAPLQLVDIPTDPKYRATLRVYGNGQEPVEGVLVRVIAQDTGNLIEQYPIDLRGIVTAVFEPFPLHPSYAQLDPLTPAVRASGRRVRVELYAQPPVQVLPPSPVPLWAFVSITDNDTQQVTTISPKR